METPAWLRFACPAGGLSQQPAVAGLGNVDVRSSRERGARRAPVLSRGGLLSHSPYGLVGALAASLDMSDA
jgi:hypothetical protein